MNIKIALSFIFIVSRLYAQTNLLSFPAGIADELDILAKHDYEKYGILFSDPICPLGWSRDGKIAYIDGRYSSSVPSTSYKLIIQDLVTDKTVFSTEWISDYENPAFDKNEVKSIKNEEYEPGSYINFYMAYKQLIDSKLDDFNITKSSQFKAYGFPIEHNGKFYNPKVVITQKDDSDDFHQIFHFAVEILSSDNLKKTIYKEKNNAATRYDAQVIGTLVSPYENRLAVILAYYDWGFEAENNVTFRLIGSSLVTGFNK